VVLTTGSTIEICPKATFNDLDASAIQTFQEMWHRKSGNSRIGQLDLVQLLVDAELIIDGGITFAALILFGTPRALGQYLPQAEVIFEYRSSEASGPAAQRENIRRGFFSYQDELWSLINLRNDLQHYQQGFVVFDIPTFNETVVREAILNAVSHRDYRLGGSVFIRQYQRRLEIVSPGGFVAGVSVENLLERHVPRNRRIAETFARCGLVERAGQGMNLIYERCIQESKPTPDFLGTDDYQVSITLRGEVQDPIFVRFLNQVGAERVASFSTHDFLVLDLIRREQPISPELKPRLLQLLEHGIVERMGRGRGTTYILSQKLYGLLGKRGTYTARRGLDRETNKLLLLKHIRENREVGSPLADLKQVLPALSKDQVQTLMRELKIDELIYHTGKARAARWFPKHR
jgi:ATP-dependent DNA helicase RecG